MASRLPPSSAASRWRKIASAAAIFSMLQDKVLHEPAVLPELLEMLTVQVSEMYRDPSYFRALRER